MSYQFDIEAAKKLPKLSPEDSRELAVRYKKDVERIDRIEGVANIDKWQVVKNNILESDKALILAELIPLAYAVFVFLLMDFHVFAMIMFGFALAVMVIIFMVYLGACVIKISITNLVAKRLMTPFYHRRNYMSFYIILHFI